MYAARAVSRHVLQVQWLSSDWLDCVAFWRRRENYPQNSHCLRVLVIFEKERSQSTLLPVALHAELTDTHTGSGHMQSLTTLLKAKRVAEKLFKSS